MSKYLQLVLILAVCSCISNSEPIGIEELNDSNYASIVNSGSQQDKWLIVFYLPSCPHCTKTLEYLDKIQENENSIENIKLGKIDCNSNSILCVSFQIKTVPHIVKLIDNKMIIFKGFPGLNEMISFANKEHAIEEAEDVPSLLSYFQFGAKILEEGLQLFNEFMTSKLKEYDLEFEWSVSLSILLLISGIAFIILIEVVVLVYCCGETKKKPNKATKPPVELGNQANPTSESEEKKDALEPPKEAEINKSEKISEVEKKNQ